MTTHAASPAPLMTARTLEQLRSELERLRRKTRDQVEQRLREARPYGEGSNNDEYHADSGTRRRYQLSSAHQELGPDRISAASPMGQALLGARPGAVLTIELPSGRSRSVRLVSVTAPPAVMDGA